VVVPSDTFYYDVLLSYYDLARIRIVLGPVGGKLFFEDDGELSLGVSPVGVLAAKKTTLLPGVVTPVEARSPLVVNEEPTSGIVEAPDHSHAHTSTSPLFVESEIVTIGDTLTIKVVNISGKPRTINAGTPLASIGKAWSVLYTSQTNSVDYYECLRSPYTLS